jgi:hypothetical protein
MERETISPEGFEALLLKAMFSKRRAKQDERIGL